MTEELRSKLQPVQRRQLFQSMSTWVITGLLCGAAIGIGCALARLAVHWLDGSWMAAAALIAGPALAGLAAIVLLMPRPNWVAAARAVDHHYGLKDRTESALDFASRHIPADKQAFAELQLADAMRHLDTVEPEVVAPFKAPRLLTGALVATAAAVIFSLIPLKQEELVAGPTVPDEQIVAEALAIEESIKELEEEFQNDSDPGLEQLLKELKQKTEELKDPGVDVKEALAKISEMQAAIQSAQSQSSLEQVDQQLQEVGEAMASAKALEGAGQALAEGKYDKAMKELAELSELEFDRNEARTTAEKLKKAAKRSSNGADGAISDAAKDLADGIEEDDDDKALAGARKLGEKAGKQARKKRINDLLNAELAELSDRKCNCQQNSTAKGKKKQKSTSSSSNWGMSESGNIDGDATSLNSEVNREQVAGMAGEGDSDFETSSSSEGRQEAQRGYKDVYQQYKKMSEAVLENEQIPLGHRQTIRRYFESIRPQQSEEPEKN
ncbi:hypothetical protein [Schlesneria sp. T3-172]|uniref:hypothetical protein n=1 Tax=Schlesneria sphaerica TaxID=3373610 RepID=UPI0037CBA020